MPRTPAQGTARRYSRPVEVSGPRGLDPVRLTLLVILVTWLVFSPIFLFGALSPLIQVDVEIGPRDLGFGVAIFYGSAAAAAIPAGWVSAKIGPRRVVIAAIACASVSMFSGALLTDSWPVLTLVLAVAGAANGIGQVSTNHLVVETLSSGRRGLVFGVKQAAAPLAAMTAGLAVPLIAIPLGWRSAFLAVALISMVAVAAVPRRVRRTDVRPPSPALTNGRPLVVVAVGATLGAMAATSVAPFLVDYLIRVGIPLEVTGVILAAGSASGALSRIAAGGSADRFNVSALHLMAALQVLGGLGLLLLAIPGPGILTVASALLAFVGSWGWAGLLALAASDLRPSAPASAFGRVAIGPYLGGVAGPLLMGSVAGSLGYQAAWITVAICSVTAGLTMVAAARR